MRIGTNIAAIISNNSLQKSQNNLTASIARLSSGYKLNSSADDAAGMAISEKMRVQLRGLDQAENNTADGISVISTAEGAISEIQNMLARLKELTVQAANDVNSDEEREAIQAEINQINQEIDRISDETEFNTQSLINGNLSRRVYSDVLGVTQLSVSDNYVAGIYGVTVLEDARQAVCVGSGNINITAPITEDQAGSIKINGYEIAIEEGDTLDTVIGKIIDGVNMVGGSAFAVTSTDNDTAANSTEYAGYTPSTTYQGSKLVMMTNQFGSDQKFEITCTNADLATMLGIPEAATDAGIKVSGKDIKAEISKDASGERVGFDDSAIISTKGTVVTVTDVNNKSFVVDIPGNVAGTKFDDTNMNGASTVLSSTAKEINQEVTDVGTMSIHVGANENQVIIIDIPPITTYTIGTEHLNVMTQYTASQAIASVDEAISKVNEIRSKLGAYENRLEHTTNNLEVSNENLTKSLSTMIDTDMAEEMTEYTSQTVITQAATSILSQANQRPAEVLQILQ